MSGVEVTPWPAVKITPWLAEKITPGPSAPKWHPKCGSKNDPKND